MDAISLVAVGLSHHQAPVGLRERVAIPKVEFPLVLRTLRELPGITECVIVSTCNRTELYAIVSGRNQPTDGYNQLRFFLASRAGLPVDEITPFTYALTDLPVAKHLFRVASGLDSLIVGEVEILGQVKEALQAAEQHHTGGKWLYTLFRRAIEAGKRARAETRISAGAASVSWAAVELARERVPDLARAQVLLIGAGTTAEAVARALVAQGVEGTMVANRTPERAERLAREVNGAAVPFSQLLSFLAIADVVITSTDAPHPILTAASIRSSLVARRGHPLYIIDVAVPRDVEPAVTALDGVEVFDIDTLASRAQDGLRQRAAEVAKVDQIVAVEVERFAQWQSSLRVTSTIVTLRERAESVRRAELRRVSTRLSRLSPEEREAIEIATRAIVNKMLHHPISVLKETALHGTDGRFMEAVEELFDLDAAPTPEPMGSPSLQA